MSEAATTDANDKVIKVMDVARAFFEAPVHRHVCIELPEEDLEPHEIDQDLVGQLQMSLYGTRVAAANWQRLVMDTMHHLRFKSGKYNPCTFWHPLKKLTVLVHGDDFVAAGSRHHATWLETSLKERFKQSRQKLWAMGLER